MYRWWLDNYSFVLYSTNSDTVTFCSNSNNIPSRQQPSHRRCRRRRQRLSISWSQFTKLNDVIDVMNGGYDLSPSNWNLGDGLWLVEMHRDGCVRLQVNHSQYFTSSRQRNSHYQRLLFYDFEPHAWMRYKSRVQQHIVNTRRFIVTASSPSSSLRLSAATNPNNTGNNVTVSSRRRWRPRRSNCERYPHCERHVRRQSSYNNRPRENASGIVFNNLVSTDDDDDDDQQVVPRATTNATRLPSVVAPQYPDIPLRQDTSNGETFSFRRAVNDYLRDASASPKQQQERNSDNNDSELAEFSNLCSLNYACEIE